MSWEILPDLSHTPANAQLDAVMVVNSRKLSRKYHTNWVLNPGPVVCESSTLSARPQLLPVTDLEALNTQMSTELPLFDIIIRTSIKCVIKVYIIILQLFFQNIYKLIMPISWTLKLA